MVALLSALSGFRHSMTLRGSFRKRAALHLSGSQVQDRPRKHTQARQRALGISCSLLWHIVTHTLRLRILLRHRRHPWRSSERHKLSSPRPRSTNPRRSKYHYSRVSRKSTLLAAFDTESDARIASYCCINKPKRHLSNCIPHKDLLLHSIGKSTAYYIYRTSISVDANNLVRITRDVALDSCMLRTILISVVLHCEVIFVDATAVPLPRFGCLKT